MFYTRREEYKTITFILGMFAFILFCSQIYSRFDYAAIQSTFFRIPNPKRMKVFSFNWLFFLFCFVKFSFSLFVISRETQPQMRPWNLPLRIGVFISRFAVLCKINTESAFACFHLIIILPSKKHFNSAVCQLHLYE